MAKLPKKLVQAPSFDSPLRRTVSPELTVVDKADKPHSNPTPEPVVESRPSDEHLQSESDELCQRVTVRLSQRQWEAIQTECFQQRMRGKKINAAALVRDIVDGWMASSSGLRPKRQKARSDRSELAFRTE